MPKTNNIDFNLNFRKGNISGLESLKKDLTAIKTLVSDPDWALHPLDISNVMSTVNTLQNALNKAFDPQLNTINIQKFNQILKQSGLNATTLQQNLALAGTAGNQAFLKLTAQLMQFNTATKQTNRFLDTMATSFFNTLRWTALSGIVHSMGGEIQKAYYYVKDLDRSLNDIRIVTGKNADEMERFAETANEAAKQLAVTTKNYTEGSLIYYQQGLDDETVKTLTDITAMTSNVTGQSMETVSEELTAVWNGYQVANQAAEEGMQVYQEYVDKMAAVGATTASDLQELATAMSKVASAASSMGVNFDDLAAQIATIVSVTRQAPESVGTALKTIYARLGDLKVDGVDEFGTKLGEVSSQLQTMGIDILDTNGDMRDMSSVMAEVAEKWDTWTSAQKQAAAVAMAGKRQYNNLVALFDNWDMYGEALETSMSAAGTLEEQQEIALESLANKMDILSATAEDLYDSLLDENTIKDAVDGLTKIVQLLADFADATGGLNNLLPLLGSTATRVFNQQIADGLSTIIINAQNAKTSVQTLEENAAVLRGMFSNSSLFTPVTGDNNVITAQKEGVKQLLDYYNQMQPYQSIMNQEQKEGYNNILNMTEKAGELNVQIENQKNSWLALNKVLINNKVVSTDMIQNLSNNTDHIIAKVQNIREGIPILEERYKQLNNQTVESYNAFSEYLAKSEITNENVTKAILNRFNQLNGSTRPLKEVLEIIIAELKEAGNSAEGLVRLQTEMDNLRSHAESTGESLRQNLDLKQTISTITTTIGTVGQLASAFSMLSNTIDILKDDSLSSTEQTTRVLMNLSMSLPMLISAYTTLNETIGIGKVIKGAYISITKRLAIATGAEAAATANATIAQEGLNVAMKANPIGAVILALTALIGVLTVVENHYEKIKQEAKEAAEEAQNSATALQEEAEAHKSLTDEYNTAYEQYKQGAITKEELWKTTDKLIDAYDLESSRISILSENYADFANAVKKAREEEEQELIIRNREAIF